MASPSASHDSDRPRRDETADAISDSAALLEVSSILNASQDLEFILGNVLLTSMGKLMIAKGAVYVQADERTYLRRIAKGMHGGSLPNKAVFTAAWTRVLRVDDIPTETGDESADFAAHCRGAGISVLIPMLLNDRMVGFVALGAKGMGKAYEPCDTTFLESVAAIAASAVNNALAIARLRDSNRRLDSKVQEMNTLFELSREMNTTFDEQRILRVLSYAIMGQIRATRYAVFSYDGSGFRPVLVKHPSFKERKRCQRHMGELESPIILGETRNSSRDCIPWLSSLGFQIVIPMRVVNQTRGVLCLGERLGASTYHEAEIDYLAALANITITALENARLFKETLEKQRLEKELSVARVIQKGLLPRTIPAMPNYDIAAVHESSQLVGGDYYDVIPLDESACLIAIGDVSGKGIPASLLMANVQAALRTMAPLRLPLPEASARLNTLVFNNTGADKFITFFWGVLDTAAHTLRYVNCGHNPPYLIRTDGTVVPLSSGGLILGILPEVPPYEEDTVRFEPGDTLVSYTDGVNEAMSKSMKEFGDDRLVRILTENRHCEAAAIIDITKKAILDFTRGAQQSDDITMLVVRRLS